MGIKKNRLTFWTRVRGCGQVIGLIILCLLTACNGIPKAELNGYAEAFSTARSVSEAILVDYEAAQKENAAIEAAIAARGETRNPPIPVTFNPQAAKKVSATFSTIV